jgi:hypothetical protein
MPAIERVNGRVFLQHRDRVRLFTGSLMAAEPILFLTVKRNSLRSLFAKIWTRRTQLLPYLWVRSRELKENEGRMNLYIFAETVFMTTQQK